MRFVINSLHNIWNIQQAIHPQTLPHILIAHQWLGVTPRFHCREKESTQCIGKRGLRCTGCLPESRSGHDEIAQVEEKLLNKLCSPTWISDAPDQLRHVMYMQIIGKSTTFSLQSLPPTSAAATFHSYSVYFAIQKWLGNLGNLNQTSSGWKVDDGALNAIRTDKAVATFFRVEL